VGLTVLSPSGVNAEVERTNLFCDQLSSEIANWYSDGLQKNRLTPAQHDFYNRFGAWRLQYNAWFNKNHPVTWTDVLVLKNIEEENDKWQKQAETYQKEFKSQGGTSNVKPTPGNGGGDGFLAGLGTGGLIAIAVLGYVLLSQRDSR
jgi:hypothetical protein